MANRAMNNQERQASSMMKKAGFLVFWHEANGNSELCATHPKLKMQYFMNCFDQALKDLKTMEEKTKTLKEGQTEFLF